MSLWTVVLRCGLVYGYLVALMMFGVFDAWKVFHLASAPLWTPFLDALSLLPFTIAVSAVVASALKGRSASDAKPSWVRWVIGTLVAALGFAVGGLPLFILIGIMLIVAGALLTGDRARTERRRSPWALGAFGGLVGGAVGGILALAAALLIPPLLRVWIPSPPLDGGYGLDALVLMFQSACANVVVGAIVGVSVARDGRDTNVATISGGGEGAPPAPRCGPGPRRSSRR